MIQVNEQQKAQAKDITHYLDSVWLNNLSQQREAILSKLEKSDPTVKQNNTDKNPQRNFADIYIFFLLHIRWLI